MCWMVSSVKTTLSPEKSVLAYSPSAPSLSNIRASWVVIQRKPAALPTTFRSATSPGWLPISPFSSLRITTRTLSLIDKASCLILAHSSLVPISNTNFFSLSLGLDILTKVFSMYWVRALASSATLSKAPKRSLNAFSIAPFLLGSL